jgi:hypothetical protein
MKQIKQPQVLRLRLTRNARQTSLRMTTSFSMKILLEDCGQ